MLTRLHGVTKAEIAHSVMRLDSGGTVWGSDVRGLEIFCAHPVRLQDPVTLLCNEKWGPFRGSKVVRASPSQSISI